MLAKALAENAGLNAIEIISSPYAEHADRNVKVGINLGEGTCKDFSAMNVWDLYITKLAAHLAFHIRLLWLHRFFALKYAADAACTVLRVDRIIIAKPAGGPRGGNNVPGYG